MKSKIPNKPFTTLNIGHFDRLKKGCDIMIRGSTFLNSFMCFFLQLLHSFSEQPSFILHYLSHSTLNSFPAHQLLSHIIGRHAPFPNPHTLPNPKHLSHQLLTQKLVTKPRHGDQRHPLTNPLQHWTSPTMC